MYMMYVSLITVLLHDTNTKVLACKTCEKNN